MGRFGVIGLVFILFFGVSSYASDDSTYLILKKFLNTDTSASVDTKALITFIDQLEKKRPAFKNERDFLQFLFYKTHQKFLKRYEAYTSFSDLVARGHYDCLTGTALYTLLLDHFQIEYTSIETNYHIFILATVDNKPILLEATDPLNGFTVNEKEINSKLESYRHSAVQNSESGKQTHYEFSFNIWEPVSPEELTGLLHFNQAIKYYNEHELEASTSHLVKAALYRPSERIEEFAALVIATVTESKLPANLRQTLIRQLKEAQKRSTQLMSASLEN
jgi:hypothetical protein